MNEQTVLTLLSQVAGRFIDQLDHRWSDDQRAEVASWLADATWNALIFLARQTLARGETLSLDEFGRLERTESGWSFEPAASLIEAAELVRQPQQGTQEAVLYALFYLRQATRLLASVPSDLAIPVKSARSPEEKVMQLLFAEPRTLSEELYRFEAQLHLNVARLRRRSSNLAHRGEEVEATAAEPGWQVDDEVREGSGSRSDDIEEIIEE